MSTTNLTLQPGSLPSGFCYPSTPQELLNKFMEVSYAVFGGTNQTFVIGASTPASTDRDKPWIKLDANDAVEGIYYYSGAWIRKHPVPASSSYRALWVGTTTELLTFDGGVNEAVGSDGYTGPMWEVDTDFAAKTLIGPGTLPSTSTVVGAGTQGGAEQVELDTTNLPAHSHPPVSGGGVSAFLTKSNGSAALWNILGGGTAQMAESTVTGETGSGTPFSIMPPYRGIYVIKRTARVYYKAT